MHEDNVMLSRVGGAESWIIVSKGLPRQRHLASVLTFRGQKNT